jgi:superfamily II DNA/RNA helicase
VELSGKVPVPKRAALIREFEENLRCRVFLSTEAGGAGLNLQVADTVINFELPWNPAKKNQRIGRIDRLGQQSGHLTVINLIARDSIESRIAEGLLLKQDLFEGVLSPGSTLDNVDFADRGRPQFLEQLEAAVEQFSRPVPPESEAPASAEATVATSDPCAEPVETETPVMQPVAAAVAVEQKASSPYAVAGASPEKLAQVMNQGMAFLSGLMQMATGQALQAEEGAISVDPATGEVTMKFKLPGF